MKILIMSLIFLFFRPSGLFAVDDYYHQSQKVKFDYNYLKDYYYKVENNYNGHTLTIWVVSESKKNVADKFSFIPYDALINHANYKMLRTVGGFIPLGWAKKIFCKVTYEAGKNTFLPKTDETAIFQLEESIESEISNVYNKVCFKTVDFTMDYLHSWIVYLETMPFSKALKALHRLSANEVIIFNVRNSFVFDRLKNLFLTEGFSIESFSKASDAKMKLFHPETTRQE